MTRSEKKAHLVAYKGGRCKDCNGVFPLVCYDFDHVDPSKKSFEISQHLGRSTTMPVLKEEADKCDLVCANCHRIRTSGDERISEKLRINHKGGRKRIYENEAHKRRVYRLRKKQASVLGSNEVCFVPISQSK